MYIRQAKQFLRNVDASFDERKFGFASLVDLMRACQREGLFRIERDRQGVMRIFPVQRDAGGVRAGDRRARGDGRDGQAEFRDATEAGIRVFRPGGRAVMARRAVERR